MRGATSGCEKGSVGVGYCGICCQPAVPDKVVRIEYAVLIVRGKSQAESVSPRAAKAPIRRSDGTREIGLVLPNDSALVLRVCRLSVRPSLLRGK